MRYLLVALLVLAPVDALADQISLEDGTTVNGELVDFQNGVYTVKIGKFMKQIPESRVVDVRAETGVAQPAAQPPAGPAPAPTAVAQPAPQPGLPPAPQPRQPSRGIGSSPIRPGVRAASGAYQPPVATPVLAPGASGVSQAQIQESMRSVQALPGGAIDPAIAGAVQRMMNGQANMSELQQLQNNPAMEKMVERFSDPAYQQQLMQGLRDMHDQHNPGQPNPMLDQLQGLFQQLNTVRGQRTR